MHISQSGALAIDRFEIRKTGLLLRSQGEQEDEQAEGEEGTNFQVPLPCLIAVPGIDNLHRATGMRPPCNR